MTPAELSTLLLFYALSVAVIAGAAIVVGALRKLSIAVFLIACVGGAIAVTIGALTDPDGNYLSQLVAGLVGLKRTALSSTALGIGLATPWVRNVSTCNGPLVQR